MFLPPSRSRCRQQQASTKAGGGDSAQGKDRQPATGHQPRATCVDFARAVLQSCADVMFHTQNMAKMFRLFVGCEQDNRVGVLPRGCSVNLPFSKTGRGCA